MADESTIDTIGTWAKILAPAIQALVELGVKLAAEKGIGEAEARAALVSEMIAGAAAGDADVAAVALALEKARLEALLPTTGAQPAELPAEPNPVRLAGPSVLPADGEG